MIVVQYEKAPEGGIADVKSREILSAKHPQTAIEKVEALFDGVPVWGGREWETLSVDELVSIFEAAAPEILRLELKLHAEALDEFSRQNIIIKWWRRLNGWKEPSAPTLHDVLCQMAERCMSLSDWMNGNRFRPFYFGTNMTYLVEKPKLVAKRLISE